MIYRDDRAALLGLLILIILVQPLSAQVWGGDLTIPDGVLGPDHTRALLTGEWSPFAELPAVLMAERVIPHHSMDAQAVWRRAHREKLGPVAALQAHLREHYSGEERAAVEASVEGELERMNDAFDLLRAAEEVTLVVDDGRTYLESRYRGRIGGPGPDPLAIYDQNVREYAARGYTGHYAVVSAVTDAFARVSEFSSDGRESYPEGSLQYNEVLFAVDSRLRRDRLLAGLGPNDRRRQENRWRSLENEYGLYHRPHRVSSMRWLAEGGVLDERLGEGIFQRARAVKRAVADREPAAAVHELAMLRWQGHGVRKDPVEAERLFQRAMELGVVRAADDLATLYYTEFDDYVAGEPMRPHERIPELYAIAAEAGLPRAMLNLGGMYLTGHGIAQDFQEAKVWFDRAEGASGDPEFKQVCRAWSQRASDARLRQVLAGDRARLLAAEERRREALEALGIPHLQAFFLIATDPTVATIARKLRDHALANRDPRWCEAAIPVRECRQDYADALGRVNCGGAMDYNDRCGEGICDTWTGRMYPSWDAAYADKCPASEDDGGRPESPGH